MSKYDNLRCNSVDPKDPNRVDVFSSEPFTCDAPLSRVNMLRGAKEDVSANCILPKEANVEDNRWGSGC